AAAADIARRAEAILELIARRCGSQLNPPGITSFIVDLCLLYERQRLRNQSKSSLDGAPPLQVRSSCQNSKSNAPTPEMAPTTPLTALAMSSWAPGAWSMLSRPAR